MGVGWVGGWWKGRWGVFSGRSRQGFVLAGEVPPGMRRERNKVWKSFFVGLPLCLSVFKAGLWNYTTKCLGIGQYV